MIEDQEYYREFARMLVTLARLKKYADGFASPDSPEARDGLALQSMRAFIARFRPAIDYIEGEGRR